VKCADEGAGHLKCLFVPGRAIRIQHAAEGEADRKREEAAAERKRKADESEVWEKTRDTRINDWRSFQKGSKKKKKSGDMNTLG
jgi:DnaJ family protein C protein 8